MVERAPHQRIPDLVGLQLYAYDVIDEGADQVVQEAARARATALLLAVSYHEGQIEFVPGRAGDLLHNPRRTRHLIEAFFRPQAGDYPSQLTPPSTGSEGTDGEAAVMELTAAASGKMAVVPWITLLTQGVALDTPELCVCNARGDLAAAGWLCPSRAETLTFARAVVRDVIQKSQCRALFIDRMRFPEWGRNGFIDLCTCFCSSCESAAHARGLDVDTIRAHFVEMSDILEKAPGLAASEIVESFSSGVRGLRAISGRLPILEWILFRHELIEELVRAVKEEADARSVDLWLDVWPPSYGWLFGQDLSRLGRYGKWAKPFTYHRWGGGADIARLLGSLSTDEVELQKLFSGFRSLFNFPGPGSYGEFLTEGLYLDFIPSELTLAAKMLSGQAKLAAGLQLWRSGEAGVRSSLEHAWRADPDGVIFHCYGWASLEELDAAGMWLGTAERR